MILGHHTLGWTFDDMLPYFNRSETYTGVDSTGLRGTHGPTTISTFKPNEVRRSNNGYDHYHHLVS